MAKAIKQFRFFGQNPTISSSNLTFQGLVSGNIFENFLPIYKLGIQGMPGTKFYLNNSSDPIVIGITGIYELDTKGQTRITAINFSPDSIQNIMDSSFGGLIIDIMYDPGEREV